MQTFFYFFINLLVYEGATQDVDPAQAYSCNLIFYYFKNRQIDYVSKESASTTKTKKNRIEKNTGNQKLRKLKISPIEEHTQQ